MYDLSKVHGILMKSGIAMAVSGTVVTVILWYLGRAGHWMTGLSEITGLMGAATLCYVFARERDGWAEFPFITALAVLCMCAGGVIGGLL